MHAVYYAALSWELWHRALFCRGLYLSMAGSAGRHCDGGLGVTSPKALVEWHRDSGFGIVPVGMTSAGQCHDGGLGIVLLVWL